MTTDQERLKICQTCQNKSFDPKKGLVCGLTQESPAFEIECSDYLINPALAAKENVDTFYSDEVEPVSIGVRFINYLIDFIVIFLLSLGVIYLTDPSQWVEEYGILGRYMLGGAIVLAYYTGMESTTGFTIGKLITGTRVVKTDGTRPEFTQYFVRSISRLIPLEQLSFLVSEVGIHDQLSGTRVVHKAEDAVYKPLDDDVIDQF